MIYTSTAGMTPEQWLGFRKRGIGASEVGAIMGLSQYKSNVELFYDKIGQGLGFSVENIAMFMGTELEQFIAHGSFRFLLLGTQQQTQHGIPDEVRAQTLGEYHLTV